MLILLQTWQAGDVSLVRHNGDLEACLKDIKAKMLVMPCETDLYFTPEDCVYEVGLLREGKLEIIRSIWGHVGEWDGGSLSLHFAHTFMCLQPEAERIRTILTS